MKERKPSFSKIRKLVFVIASKKKFEKSYDQRLVLPLWCLWIKISKKSRKLRDKIFFKSDFRSLFWSLCVCVGDIVSDYCTFKNDLEELFFKLQKFLNYYLCLFVENRHSKTPNQRRPLPYEDCQNSHIIYCIWYKIQTRCLNLSATYFVFFVSKFSWASF